MSEQCPSLSIHKLINIKVMFLFYSVTNCGVASLRALTLATVSAAKLALSMLAASGENSEHTLKLQVFTK